MKILKRIGVVLIVLGVIYIVMAFFGPSKIHVERTAMVNCKSDVAYNEVNTLSHWIKWSYWDNIDPNMKSTFEGPESGVGAIHHWASDNDSVGNGSLTITTSDPGKWVETKLDFQDMGSSMGGWKFADTTGGTKVTAYMDMEVPFLARPVMLFMDMEKILGDDFDKSLHGLKTLCESTPSEEVTQYVSEMSNLPAWKIMTVRDSGTQAELSAKFSAMYQEIGIEMKKQGLTQAGPVLALYDRDDHHPDGTMFFVFRAGIPVDKPGKSTARVEYTETTASTAVKCNYHGGYNNMEACHYSINKFITDNGKTINGPVWEVYVTDPGAEPDSTKWLTEIYYPIQ